MLNPAILMTASRLVWAPLFVWFFLSSIAYGIYAANQKQFLISLFFLSLIELSDAFDGIIARARGEVTNFGKIFDPICDSLSRQTVFLGFVMAGIIPLWMFLIFLYRDGIMSFIRIMAAKDGLVLAARPSGKLKAIIQAIASYAVLAVVAAHSFGFVNLPELVWGKHIGYWIMLIPALVTFVSLFDYLIPNWKTIKNAARPLGNS